MESSTTIKSSGIGEVVSETSNVNIPFGVLGNNKKTIECDKIKWMLNFKKEIIEFQNNNSIP